MIQWIVGAILFCIVATMAISGGYTAVLYRMFRGLAATTMGRNVPSSTSSFSIRHHHINARLWQPTSSSSDSDSIDPTKSKIVHFIRHGQGYHNFMDTVAKEAGALISDIDDYDLAVKENRFYIKPSLEDPPLTAEGFADIKRLQETVSNKSGFNPQLFIVSPLRRATQTVLFGFHHHIAEKQKHNENRQIPIIALECCREQFGIYYSDKRSDISQYTIEFPNVNYEHIQSNEDILWEKKSRESMNQLLSRQAEFLSFIRKQTEVNEIVVGTHSGWLKVLTNSVLNIEIPDQREGIQSMFETGEIRSLLLTWVDGGPP